jgi:hypothetical protein
MLSKDVIRSYEDMEKLLVLKERLVALSTHHIDIFG